MKEYLPLTLCSNTSINLMASPFESQLQQPSIPPEVLAYDYINRARGRNYAELLKLDIRERELARKHQADEKSLER